jgi:AcrR family transcriptional regulator
MTTSVHRKRRHRSASSRRSRETERPEDRTGTPAGPESLEPANVGGEIEGPDIDLSSDDEAVGSDRIGRSRGRRSSEDDRGRGDVGDSRAARKQRTRVALMDAALTLMSGGRSYTSLSLREITREAGVVPTSFYRHFHDLDELGLALVEETGLTLRRLLREARRSGVPPIRIIEHSVRIYREFVREHRLHVMFMASERWGGSPLIRRSIRYETQHFATEMAQDLRELSLLPHLSMQTLQIVCGLVVNTMLNAASDFTDLPSDNPKVEEELAQTFVRQLRVIFLGAVHWKDAGQ